MVDITEISKTLVCPQCHLPLVPGENSLRCEVCNQVFVANRYEYFDFILNSTLYGVESVTEDYATIQHECGDRVYEEYIKGYLSREPFSRVLDVGCGIGRGIMKLLEEGYEAYGVDLPNLSRFWSKARNDPDHFFCCDAAHLPFPDNFFDVIFSLGVIEHIGTQIGHCTLVNHCDKERQKYANEILRVTRPRGRILISCPNKHFPIDIQHGPRDVLSPPSRLRSFLFEKTGLNVHPTWGRYHLLSYSETERLFCKHGGARAFYPQRLKGFFAFTRIRPLAFRRLVTLYCNHLPRFLLPTFFNPYVLVEIRK
jgi:SAM-dependent methyltransferase